MQINGKERMLSLWEWKKAIPKSDQASSTQNVSARAPIIREFEPFKIPEDTKNLILDSSITARIRTETISNDTIILSFRDSSTEEKLRRLTKNSSSEFKCVIIQAGTNSILMRKNENFLTTNYGHQLWTM